MSRLCIPGCKFSGKVDIEYCEVYSNTPELRIARYFRPPLKVSISDSQVREIYRRATESDKSALEYIVEKFL
jgi:hypothetical protein